MGEAGCLFFSSRRRHTRYWRDWSSDVCSSDLRRGQNGRRLQAAEVVGKKSDRRRGACEGAPHNDYGSRGVCVALRGEHAHHLMTTEMPKTPRSIVGFAALRMSTIPSLESSLGTG